MKKAIVTGGAGFIGSHLAESLFSRGYHVTIFDNLSTGKKGNVANLVKKDNVRFVQGSILDLHLLQESFRGLDYVFH